MSVTPDRRPPRRSATDLAYDALKRRVLVCELGPGTELRENDLAAQLGVSRTPVREALNRLVYDGFVEVRPRQGYRVTDVTLAGVHEVFELRAQLEPPIVRLAASRAGEEQIATLGELARSCAPERFEDCITCDHELHVYLADMSGNRRMARVMRQLLAEMQRILFLSLSHSPTGAGLDHEHESLYEAVAARDADRAAAITADEIEGHRRRVLEALITRMPPVPLNVGLPPGQHS